MISRVPEQNWLSFKKTENKIKFKKLINKVLYIYQQLKECINILSINMVLMVKWTDYGQIFNPYLNIFYKVESIWGSTSP